MISNLLHPLHAVLVLLETAVSLYILYISFSLQSFMSKMSQRLYLKLSGMKIRSSWYDIITPSLHVACCGFFFAVHQVLLMVEIPLVLTGAVLTGAAMVVAGSESSLQLRLCNILLLYLECGGFPIWYLISLITMKPGSKNQLLLPYSTWQLPCAWAIIVCPLPRFWCFNLQCRS